MNIVQIIITTLLSVLIIIIPFVIFGYAGIKLRKYLVERFSSKYPEKTEKDIRKRAMIAALGIVVLAIILLSAVTYAWLYFSKISQKINTAENQLSALSPKIDMHEHFRVGGNINYYLNAMQAAHIEKMVLLPTDWPPSNPKYKENMEAALKAAKDNPGKFIVFATALNKDPKAAEIIEEAIKNGAGGIKFIDWLYSSKYPEDAGPVNSPNMYKVYKVAEKYKVPALLHIDFQKKPEWRDQFWRVASDFPNVTFILADYCGAVTEKISNLKLCAETLDKFPNVYTDISMGGALDRYAGYLDRGVRPYWSFIMKYQDRVVWGSNIVLDGKLYKGEVKDTAWIFKRMLTDFFILELKGWRSVMNIEDKAFHRGLNLPKEVLQKIYWENPKKVLKL